MSKILETIPHDSIRGFYKDQNVFITGATGFFKKVIKKQKNTIYI